jgi:hypothetical protein
MGNCCASENTKPDAEGGMIGKQGIAGQAPEPEKAAINNSEHAPKDATLVTEMNPLAPHVSRAVETVGPYNKEAGALPEYASFPVLGPYKEANGDTYQGQYKNGLKHGFGKLVTPDGRLFEGYWNQNMGTGKVRIIDENTYEGDWRNGNKDGQGRETNQNGDEYTGSFQNNFRHGQGTYRKANGDNYVGNFNNGKYDGLGKMVWKDGKSYEGGWSDGKIHGKGSYIWVDGQKYLGEYVNEVKEGYGEFYWADKKIYKGHWKGGKQHGTGTFIDPNGNARDGEWEQGKFKGWLKTTPAAGTTVGQSATTNDAAPVAA